MSFFPLASGPFPIWLSPVRALSPALAFFYAETACPVNGPRLAGRHRPEIERANKRDEFCMARRVFLAVTVAIHFLAIGLGARGDPQERRDDATAATQVNERRTDEFVEQHCVECHGDADKRPTFL